MKRILGISVAVLIVIVQVAGYAAWHADAATELSPVEGPELVHGHA